MTKLKMIIGADRPGYDHYTIRWEDKEGRVKGVGFKTKDGKYGLLKCPECGKENYAINALSSSCAWCAFTISPKENE